MNRVSAFAAGAVGVVAVALLVGAVVPGALADPTDEGPTRPGPVRIAEVTIAPGQVSGQSAVLQVETRLTHRGPATSNVSVLFRAVDAESGMVATTQRVEVGTVEEDGEVPVRANLTVEREGGYRIETVVFRDAERIDTGGRQVSGLSALVPEGARTSVRFTEADALPPLSFSVVDGGDNRTTLDVSASLTNRGDGPSEDLRVTLVLRQAESNIVAARQDVTVGTIQSLRTATVSTEMTVPDGYNYYIDAILWKDGVMVDTARSAANLDPTKTISVNETEQEVELEVSDFESGDGRDGRPEPTREPEAGTVEQNAPGFGVAVALAALLAAALLARRRSA